MLLPSSAQLVQLLTILAVILTGSWMVTFKLGGPKRRFEVYYMDFALGTVALALLAAFTLGSMGEELSFSDNLIISGKKQMTFALLGGGIFNLGNMLLIAGASVAGMSVAFPAAYGVAGLIGAIAGYLLNRGLDPVLTFGGGAVLLGAAVVAAVGGALKPGSGVSPIKGAILSAVGGVFLGASMPMTELSRAGGAEVGLGPYAIAVFVSVGIFFSTIIYLLYFINLPVHGEPLGMSAYLKVPVLQHLLAFLGGMLACAAMLGFYIIDSVPAGLRVAPMLRNNMLAGAVVVAAVWGLIWGERKSAKGLIVAVLALLIFAVGSAAVSMAIK